MDPFPQFSSLQAISPTEY